MGGIATEGITGKGIDDLMIVRVLLAQLISFAVVMTIWKRQKPGEA